MENKKQSSVDWLISELQRRILIIESEPDGIVRTTMIDNFLVDIEQAKAMHRSEIEDAYDRKVINEKQNWFIRSGKHYYDPHYGEQNSSVSIENNI